MIPFNSSQPLGEAIRSSVVYRTSICTLLKVGVGHGRSVSEELKASDAVQEDFKHDATNATLYKRSRRHTTSSFEGYK